MDKEPVSLWADIKKYEDMLANDPHSYCFTLLSELYRKLGLLDDAVDVANRGIEKHPEYIGGYMAAGRAYFEKGLKEESRKALERVVRATPDNLLGQKLLSQIYMEQGDVESAVRTLKVVELLNPQDVECRLMLEALLQPDAGREESADVRFAFPGPDEAKQPVPGDTLLFGGGFGMSAAVDEECDDEQLPEAIDCPADETPLATATLAELYVSQGFIELAVEVYEDLLIKEPDNCEYRGRLEELRHTGAAAVPEVEICEPESTAYCSNAESAGFENMDGAQPIGLTQVPGAEDGILSILEGWLRNIKRGRYAAEGDTQKYC